MAGQETPTCILPTVTLDSAPGDKEFVLVEVSDQRPAEAKEAAPGQQDDAPAAETPQPPEHIVLPLCLGTLGRKAGNDLRIDDHQISKYHFAFIVHPGTNELEVKDLGSTNGTIINGTRRDTATRLKEGDFLKVGKRSYRFMVQVRPKDLKS